MSTRKTETPKHPFTSKFTILFTPEITAVLMNVFDILKRCLLKGSVFRGKAY